MIISSGNALRPEYYVAGAIAVPEAGIDNSRLQAKGRVILLG